MKVRVKAINEIVEVTESSIMGTAIETDVSMKVARLK
jgi:hypothetical protein